MRLLLIISFIAASLFSCAQRNQKKLETSFDFGGGNHFFGKTNDTNTNFKSLGMNHYNIGAMHKFPNSRLSGRFDIVYDIFSEVRNQADYKTKYFRTTYQFISDIKSRSPYQGNESPFKIAFGAGIGLSTMYNAQSKNNSSDPFLNGDDMITLAFSLIPSYKINSNFSLVSNLSLVIHSLQTNSWDLSQSQGNSAFNGRFMNLSFGLRYHLDKRLWK